MRKLVFTAFIYFASLVCFGLALYFPIFNSKTSILGFTLEEQSMRIIDSVNYFWDEGDVFLGLVILVFTIIFPALKYIDLAIRLFFTELIPKRVVRILTVLDKWSMLDVFLVALLIMNFKLDTSLVVIKLQVGTTFIAIAVILRMLASHFISQLEKQLPPD